MRSPLYLTGRTPSPFSTEPEHLEQLLACRRDWADSASWKHSPDQGLETGIVAQSIETRIDLDPNQPMRPFLNCLAQPDESLVLFLHPGVNECIAIRGHKPGLADLIKPL